MFLFRQRDVVSIYMAFARLTLLSVEISKYIIKHWDVLNRIFELYAHDKHMTSAIHGLTTLVVREATPEHSK